MTQFDEIIANRRSIRHLMFAISVSSFLMAQNTTVYRDNLGRKTGTATKDSRGVTTYRNELGRKTGTSEKNSWKNHLS